MKINYKEDLSISESIVDILAVPGDALISKVLLVLDSKDNRLVVEKNNINFLVEKDNFHYIEYLDERLYLYTEKELYESPLRLYEVEEAMPANFLRISKSIIVNLLSVESIKPDFGNRLILTLKNKESLVVNRSYVKEFKRKINMR